MMGPPLEGIPLILDRGQSPLAATTRRYFFKNSHTL